MAGVPRNEPEPPTKRGRGGKRSPKPVQLTFDFA
jgi:hypothetical protein